MEVFRFPAGEFDEPSVLRPKLSVDLVIREEFGSSSPSTGIYNQQDPEAALEEVAVFIHEVRNVLWITDGRSGDQVEVDAETGLRTIVHERDRKFCRGHVCKETGVSQYAAVDRIDDA